MALQTRIRIRRPLHSGVSSYYNGPIQGVTLPAPMGNTFGIGRRRNFRGLGAAAVVPVAPTQTQLAEVQGLISQALTQAQGLAAGGQLNSTLPGNQGTGTGPSLSSSWTSKISAVVGPAVAAWIQQNAIDPQVAQIIMQSQAAVTPQQVAGGYGAASAPTVPVTSGTGIVGWITSGYNWLWVAAAGGAALLLLKKR